jgi:Zn-dependent peptidase ImmA (M78 family)
VPVFGVPAQVREEQRRFSLCRALSDYLASGLPSLVTRSQTEHQQRNRAFAAQFLAPAESIRKRIMGWSPDEDGVYELAREFRVSELVIRHQIRNHGLAELVGE